MKTAPTIDKTPFYFYHLLPKGTALTEIGITSLEYQYFNDIDQFRKNSNKYRRRLCGDWGIYPGRTPESLSDDEVYYGIIKFRNDPLGCNYIYAFRYPPFTQLGHSMREVLRYKDIWRINVSSKDSAIAILDIEWGHYMSNTDNPELNEAWYRTITKEEYFHPYTEKGNGLLFAPLNHIAIKPRYNYLPKRLWEPVKTPNTISDIMDGPCPL